MKALKQYVELIEQYKIKKADLMAHLGREHTNFYKLYSGIAENKWKNDDEAARAIFGKNADAKNQSYRVLKLEFKKRLQKLILLIDFKHETSFSEYRREIYSTIQLTSVLRILIGRSKREAAKDLSLHLLEIGIEYELTESVIVATKNLRNHYLNMQPDKKKFEYYQELYVKYAGIYVAENLAEEIFHEIHKHYIETTATQKFVSDIARELLKQLLPYKNKIYTANFLRTIGLIEILPFNTLNDYVNTLHICNEYIDKLQNNKLGNSPTNLNPFFHNKASCLLMLKRYDEGIEILEIVEKNLSEGTHNWFKNRIWFMQMCLHAKKYDQAFHICRHLVSHKQLPYISTPVREEIMIYNAYLYWLVSIQSILISKREFKKLNAFDLDAFVGEITVFDKDKKGMNIPILILKILFAISQKDRALIFKHIETLQIYKRRYLNESENIRTVTLIKMLSDIHKYYYNKKQITEKVAEDFLFLKSTQQQIDNPAHELEIIPYQDAWEIILSLELT